MNKVEQERRKSDAASLKANSRILSKLIWPKLRTVLGREISKDIKGSLDNLVERLNQRIKELS